MKYRRKQTIIEPEQVVIAVGVPLPKGVLVRHVPDPDNERVVYAQLYVITIHGQETDVEEGDWILPEPDGIHFYPCKPDIFESQYEKVE